MPLIPETTNITGQTFSFALKMGGIGDPSQTDFSLFAFSILALKSSSVVTSKHPQLFNQSKFAISEEIKQWNRQCNASHLSMWMLPSEFSHSHVLFTACIIEKTHLYISHLLSMYVRSITSYSLFFMYLMKHHNLYPFCMNIGVHKSFRLLRLNGLADLAHKLSLLHSFSIVEEWPYSP